MAIYLKLSAPDRDFFALVSQAASCNPFSDERLAIDERMAGRTAGMSANDQVARLVQVVSARVKRLETEQSADIGRYAGKESELVRDAVLFDLYHRSMDAFDRLSRLQRGLADGSLDADALLAGYCTLLHARHGTYEEVARRTRLDRRTVKSYIEKQGKCLPA